MNFSDLGLRAELLRAVLDQGYDTPTPIQAQAIPVVLQGNDLMASAQTGTGKTAGFTLPILQLLSTRSDGLSPKRSKSRALILTPTRELAVQVHESVRTYGKHLGLTNAAIYGGVGLGPQAKALRAGADIIVATPGRLLDHVQQRSADLSGIERTVCWIWVSCQTSKKFLHCCPGKNKACCSLQPFPTKFAHWPPDCCAIP